MFHSLLPFEEEAVNLYRGEKKYIKYRLLNLLYRRSMRLADGLLFSSSFTEKKFLSSLRPAGGSVSKVIPFGTWSSFSNPPAPIEIESGQTVRFLYVSNFYKYKRHLMLIPLFEDLIRKGYDISLTLCGDGFSHTEEITDAVRKSHTGGRITYEGKLTHDKMQKMYQQHDVLIFPSVVESFGIPLIEAAHENLWIIFTWPPLVEIMQNNNYERYTLAQGNLEKEVRKLIDSHNAGNLNLKEKKRNSHFITFRQTFTQTMQYLESFLPETKNFPNH